ncbi:MAG: hypothetical protein DA407_12110 [Bacteroidetes bacterium]|nr:MAG: hypothetical protein DA407_12110 [Bacteroidota bacterium]
MTYKIQLSIVLASLMFLSCKDQIHLKGDYLAANDVTQSSNNHPGQKLMETYCYACHNPTTSINERLAPPMVAIKKHYINANTSKDEFINSMQAWIKNPTEDNAKMFGAVRRFGVMPKQLFAEDDIKLIADYMFDNDIDQPEWFEEHEKDMKKKN